MRNIIVSEFFTTVSYRQALDSLSCLSYRIGSLQTGKDSEKLISELKKYFGGDSNIYLFYSARIALYQYLEQNNDDQNSEVILSGYNCVSVSNAVIQAGYVPIYADIETDSLGIDINNLKTLITKKTKFIVIQHSFGLVSRDTEKIIAFARKNNIKVIEDVAHSLGARYNGKKIGTLGDAAIFSTGRDKVISSVNGGILLINEKKTTFRNISILPSRFLTVKNHLYNILGFISYKSYDIGKIGKIIMALSNKGGLFPKIVSDNEKYSLEKKLNYILPNSLAYLGEKEFKKLDKYMSTRKKHQKYYIDNLDTRFRILDNGNTGNAFRVCLICKSRAEKDSIYTYIKQKSILLGTNWSDINIAPKNTSLENANYILGSCSVAENIASRLLFLPASYTHTAKQIKETCEILNNFEK